MTKIVRQDEADQFLAQAGAQLRRADGAAKVYVSQRFGITITVFPERLGVVKLQVIRGCVC